MVGNGPRPLQQRGPLFVRQFSLDRTSHMSLRKRNPPGCLAGFNRLCAFERAVLADSEAVQFVGLLARRDQEATVGRNAESAHDRLGYYRTRKR